MSAAAWPGSPEHLGAQLDELDRLRAVEAAARAAMVKVAEHDRRGYSHIRTGAFTQLRAALDAGAP